MYTFDELIDRRHTESTKWDRYQDKLQRDDLLPMWLADMDLPASDEIKEALMKRASHPIYGYSDRGRLYYEVFAERFQKQYAYDITAEMCIRDRGVQIPRSLKNIYKELKSDMNIDAPSHGCLTDWTKQGVFLMNTVMSVREGQAASHKKKGWETFTDTVISALNEQEKGIVFVLWGSHAQKKAEMITGRQHRILMSAHPSPLSASRGFFGSRPFSTVNRYLEEMGRTPIDWRLSE